MNIWPWSTINYLRERCDNMLDRIKGLEDTVIQSYAKEREAKNQVEFLIRTLRGIDEQIFKMSQLSSWEQMQPHFASLNEGMLVRKRVESDKINDIILGELHKTYNGPMLGDH